MCELVYKGRVVARGYRLDLIRDMRVMARGKGSALSMFHIREARV